jgi:hypothetical protein
MIRLDPTKRPEAIAAGLQAYADQLQGHEEAYAKWCEGCDVLAVVADDEVIGAFYAKEGVIHIGIVEKWRRLWASRRLLREMLSYGKLTELMVGDSTAFVERIGRFDPAFGWQFRGRTCQ